MKKILFTISTVSVLLATNLNAFSDNEKVNQRLFDTFAMSSNDFSKCGVYKLMLTKSTEDKELITKYKQDAIKAFDLSYKILIDPLYPNYKEAKKITDNANAAITKLLIKEWEDNQKDFKYLENKYENICNRILENYSLSIEENYERTGE